MLPPITTPPETFDSDSSVIDKMLVDMGFVGASMCNMEVVETGMVDATRPDNKVDDDGIVDSSGTDEKAVVEAEEPGVVP